MTDAEFLQAVKRSVQEIDPQAEVWLFGSRARGDARPDSDWDFLMLTDKPVNRAFKRQVRDQLFYVGLDTGEVISSLVYNRDNWQALAVTHLYQNIQREGKWA
ncbi:nucleotidyltransferase domain-containing protein [Fibrella sp. HMF5335]|uniref:Nucleotidyltransferase domain-containing protein n=1 Tax=Fibrella rubiginis TaxID=2817060 RepID=A0A939GH09_9BACT|nr:nucleotidyltransferase domain-containing protein [Fibrella rubiginis]MBO0936303.1 nucleotidyltransferase domain-containing protein [Fibrella rubiginis]